MFTVYKLKQLVQIHLNGYKRTIGNIMVQGCKQGSFPYGPTLQVLSTSHSPHAVVVARAAFPPR